MSRSEYAALIRDTIAYLKEISPPLLISKEEWQGPPSPSLHKEMILSPKTQRMSIAEKQNISEKKKFEPKPIDSKTDSSSCLGMDHQPRPKTEQTHIKSVLQKFGVRLSDDVPDDAVATRTMLAYKERVGTADIILFASDTDAHTLEFVKNLSRSIDQKLCPIKVLRPDRWEKEESWDLFFAKNPVKLFIVTAGFVQLKKGMVHFKRVGDAMFLQNTPLILLSPSETYASKDKISLWNQICAALRT